MLSPSHSKLEFDSKLLALLTTSEAEQVVSVAADECARLFSTAGMVREAGLPSYALERLSQGQILYLDVSFQDPAWGHRVLLRTALTLFSAEKITGYGHLWVNTLISVPSTETNVLGLRRIHSTLFYSATGVPAPVALEAIVGATKEGWLSFVNSCEGSQSPEFTARVVDVLEQYCRKTRP